MKRWLNTFAVAKLIIVVAAAGLLSTAANAQSRYQGSFTLPCSAHWAGAVLPAGDYTVTFQKDHQGASSSILQVSSVNGKFGVFVSSFTMGDNVGTQDMLVLTTTGNSCEVRSLHLASLDRQFLYKPISRWERARINRGGHERLVALLVTKR